MIIHLFKQYGIIESEIVNVSDKTIELTAPAKAVKINLVSYPVTGNVCSLPAQFEWGQGANAITVIDADGNNIACGLIIRSTTGDMKTVVNIREILISLSTGLYAAQAHSKTQDEQISECLSFCKYPKLF